MQNQKQGSHASESVILFISWHGILISYHGLCMQAGGIHGYAGRNAVE
jgi:hypothetical protein